MKGVIMKSRFVSAIIVAAGNSTRMGTGRPKIFENILGLPAIAYSLMMFNRAQFIDEIIVVCKDEHEQKIMDLIEAHNIDKFKDFASGGSSRQQSVFSGVKKINQKTTHIAIHDAARILVTEETINDVIQDSFETRASATGIPMKDTVKLVNDKSFVVKTVDRSNLWCVHTPQVFEKELYFNAMSSAINANKDYTDDCQLIENYEDNKVHMIMGSYSNLKLTTPDDIPIFESILKKASKLLL